MAFYPDVFPGDQFKPNALLSNDVRHLLNRMDGFKGGTPAVSPYNSTVIKVFCDNRLKAGTAINFKDLTDKVNDVIPCEAFNNPTKAWGVIPIDLEPNKVGNCIISGCITVKVEGDVKDYVQPQSSNPEVFKYSKSGAKVLFRKNDYEAIILLDYYPLEQPEGKKEQFMVKVIERNNQFFARVYNGLNPDSEYCGTIRLLSYGESSDAPYQVIYNIPVTEIPITEEITNISLFINTFPPKGGVEIIAKKPDEDIFPIPEKYNSLGVSSSQYGRDFVYQFRFNGDNDGCNSDPNLYTYMFDLCYLSWERRTPTEITVSAIKINRSVWYEDLSVIAFAFGQELAICAEPQNGKLENATWSIRGDRYDMSKPAGRFTIYYEDYANDYRNDFIVHEKEQFEIKAQEINLFDNGVTYICLIIKYNRNPKKVESSIVTFNEFHGTCIYDKNAQTITHCFGEIKKENGKILYATRWGLYWGYFAREIDVDGIKWL